MKKIIRQYHRDIKRRAGNFSIGMRTVKTALAILICLLVFAVAKHMGIAGDFDAFLALTAAVISMQDSVKGSIQIGLNRLHGIVLGTALGMVVLYVDLVARNAIVHVLLVTVGTIIIIVVCNLLGTNQAIIMGCVVFFMIALQTTQGMSPWALGVHRFLDTMAGVVIAIAINHLIHNPDKMDDDESNEADSR
ncbi:MAG: FUSC family protein [Clostridiales Family XIII bacterium]|jgi:uncharacterized membrane protein YgaE (UPF0421/DUF939 family)|nr:FUSC family protein [Clostridiales Family XIII bacterium]